MMLPRIYRQAFSPYELGASLVAWWNADSVADGAVSEWADIVGGLAPVQATGASQPVRAAKSFNSLRPGVTFDGIDDNLRVASVGALPVAATPRRVLIVYAPVVPDGVNRHTFSYGANANGQLCRLQKNNGDKAQASDGTSATAVNAAVITSPVIKVGVFEATAYQLWQNGVLFGSVAGATLNTGTTRTCIGSGNATTPANFSSSTIRHILVGTWSDAQQLKLEGWGAWDGGFQSSLPSTHPYRYVRP